jgi:hypothetical protein
MDSVVIPSPKNCGVFAAAAHLSPVAAFPLSWRIIMRTVLFRGFGAAALIVAATACAPVYGSQSGVGISVGGPKVERLELHSARHQPQLQHRPVQPEQRLPRRGAADQCDTGAGEAWRPANAGEHRELEAVGGWRLLNSPR